MLRTRQCFVHFHFSLPNVLFATAACNFSTSELQKVLRTRHVLYIFTSECAFRHSGVQFFDIWTYKSAPNTSCFVHFHFQMCFSPQRRAFFRHLNFKKCSGHVMFCTFSLQNVLFATAACNFWFLLWAPTSAPAALTGLLFDWPDTRIIEKTQHFATSLTFGADVSSFFWLSRYCIFFLLTWLLYSAFQLSILSENLYRLILEGVTITEASKRSRLSLQLHTQMFWSLKYQKRIIQQFNKWASVTVPRAVHCWLAFQFPVLNGKIWSQNQWTALEEGTKDLRMSFEVISNFRGIINTWVPSCQGPHNWKMSQSHSYHQNDWSVGLKPNNEVWTTFQRGGYEYNGWMLAQDHFRNFSEFFEEFENIVWYNFMPNEWTSTIWTILFSYLSWLSPGIT